MPVQRGLAGGEQGVHARRFAGIARVERRAVFGGGEQAEQHRVGLLGAGGVPEAVSALLGHGDGDGFRTADGQGGGRARRQADRAMDGRNDRTATPGEAGRSGKCDWS